MTAVSNMAQYSLFVSMIKMEKRNLPHYGGIISSSTFYDLSLFFIGKDNKICFNLFWLAFIIMQCQICGSKFAS